MSPETAEALEIIRANPGLTAGEIGSRLKVPPVPRSSLASRLGPMTKKGLLLRKRVKCPRSPWVGNWVYEINPKPPAPRVKRKRATSYIKDLNLSPYEYRDIMSRS